ncbi:ArsR family transcriptional regulator [Anaerosolibacter carboniphilus]|uniref:ArsR family transcriptional regulator n=1 Tax=Anaerosolibacter carboniphilus TaxID=1417629 RepID=A0A841KVQ8_9FIRM|nr:metalloregulator ArsR/SmtB family transcription factor [Anaerosolibacter carboniphilus]MBB6216308.1 ArsR family transcriptional regulator [Anaerosolibacter carboniphilus]
MSTIFFELSSSLLKALAHPTRLQILDILKDKDELCVCHIYEDLELEQSNVSQHLKILKDQGILSSRKDGLKVMYSVKSPEVFQILDISRKILIAQLEETQNQLRKEGN